MRILFYLLIFSLTFSLAAPMALAQAQLYAQPVDTNTNSTMPIQAVPVEDTTDPDTTRDTSTPPSGDEVGGDGEDIGAPTADTADQDHKGEIDILSTSAQDGDPDQPIITGQVPNPESTGIEHDDIGIIDDDSDGTDDSGSQIVPSQVKVIILAPSSDDSSATHDPGITILETLASIGIDDDDFGFISNGKIYVRAGFVKLGDIKGESSDEQNQGGNVEITWKVEKGQKASKPKEIVVVGSKATDKATPKLLEANCKGLNATCEPQNAVTPETLLDFAQRTVNSFDSVNEIRFDDSRVEVDSTQPLKLFGFIPFNLKQAVSVSLEPDTFGRVKVKFPWYHVLGRKTVRPADLRIDLEKSVEGAEFSKWKVADFDATKNDPTTGPAGEEVMTDETKGSTDDRPTENITFNFSEVKAQLLQVMSNAIVQYNESDLNFLSR